MPFIDKMFSYSSLSIIGLSNGTGKTDCLNYLLKRFACMHKRVAVTAVGVEEAGVEVEEGMFFSSTASFFLKKDFQALICDVREQNGVLGKLVTAQAMESGRVVLAGPSDTTELSGWLTTMKERFHVDCSLVEGTLSRRCIASPAVTQALVLCVDSYSQQTRFLLDTINLPAVQPHLGELLCEKEQGVFFISPQGELVDTQAQSALESTHVLEEWLEKGVRRFYLPGVVTTVLLDWLSARKEVNQVEVIVRDFSRLFVQPDAFYAFLRKGGKMTQVFATCLAAICFTGKEHERGLSARLEKECGVPVLDIQTINC